MMKAELFKMKFILKENGEIEAKVNADKGDLEVFESSFGIDLIDIFKSDKFTECVNNLTEIVIDEINERSIKK